MLATKQPNEPNRWKKIVRELEALRPVSIKAHYTLAKGVHFLLHDRGYQDHHGGDFDKMNEEIDRYVDLFPGMTRALLCEMHNQYPRFPDWEQHGVKKIMAAALVAIGRRQNAPRLASDEPEETKPKAGRPTARRLAELEAERDREKLARVEKEREATELRDQLRAAQQRIGEMEMELTELRKRLNREAA